MKYTKLSFMTLRCSMGEIIEQFKTDKAIERN